MLHLEAEQRGARAALLECRPDHHLLAEDAASGALLLERREPSSPLSEQPEPERDRVIASWLRRLWRSPPARSFRPLSHMVRYWADIALARPHEWPDAGFVRAGVTCLLELGQPGADDALLATDRHAGNVLAARRQPWLAIESQALLRRSRLRCHPASLELYVAAVRRFAWYRYQVL